MPVLARRRMPLFLKGFLTVTSALSGICLVSAFTVAQASAVSVSAPAVTVSSPVAATLTARESAWHRKHMAHLAHLAHLTYLANLAAEAKAAAQAALAAQQSHMQDAVQPPVQQPVQAHTETVAVPVTTSGDSSFQACVIRAESGGNPQVVNASDHYGLYQFSASTWAEYGGNPADFGNASVSEQNQVFANAMATAGGASNWAPYDGC